MTIDITMMNMADYDDMIALWQATEGVDVGESDAPEKVSAYLERNPTTCFVARDNSVLIGTLQCGYDGRRGYLNHMAVADSHRRLGIGKALESKAMEALTELGVTKCILFVYESNVNGMAFWRKLGWRCGDELGVKVMTRRQ